MPDNPLHNSLRSQPLQAASSPDNCDGPRVNHLFTFTIWQHSLPLIVGILASLLAGALRASLAIVLGKVFNTISSYGGGTLSSSDTVAQVSIWCGILAILGGTGWLINFTLMFSWTVFSELQVWQARRQVFKSLLEKEMCWYDCQPNGISSFLVRTQAQIQELHTAIHIGLGNTSTDMAAFIANLFLAFYLSWKLTLVILATIPPSIATIHMISRSLKSTIELQKQEQALAIKHAFSAIAAIDLVRAFNGAEQETWRYADVIKRSMAACLVYSRASGCQMSYIKFWLESMFVLGFFYGVALVRQGVEAGNIVSSFYAALTALQAVESLISMYPTLLKGISAGRHLQHICDDLKDYKIQDSATRKLMPNTCNGEIEFHNVTFAFPSNPSSLVLENLCVAFPPRQLSFIVGPTGAGKSTIGDLLVKLYEPTTGHITIDGIPLQTLDTHWVRRNVTLVQQHTTLFDDCFFNNITFGLLSKQMTSELEINSICAAALLQHTVADLPNGLHTRIGPSGHNLSIGQMQRVAMARALVRDSEVLILDEITTGLAPLSRIIVMDTIRKWRRNKTTIVITHDMTLIEDYDYICVMGNGCSVQQGLRQDIDMNSAVVSSKCSLSDNESQDRELSFGRDEIPESNNPLVESSVTAAFRIVPAASTMLWPIPTPATPRHVGSPITIPVKSPIANTRQESTQRSWQLLIPNTKPSLESTRFGAVNLMKKIWNSRIIKDNSIVESPGDPTMSGIRFQTMPGSQPNSSKKTLHKNDSQDIPILLGNTGSTTFHEPAGPWCQVQQYRTDEQAAFLGNGSKVPPESPHDSDNLINCTNIFHRGKGNDCSSRLADKSEATDSLLAIYQTVWPQINNKTRFFLVSGLFSCLVAAASVPAFSVIFGNLLSVLSAKDSPKVAGQSWALYLLLVAVIGAIAAFLSHYLLEYTGQSWVNALRTEALSRILRQPRPFFDKPKHVPAKIMECMDHHAEEMRNLVGRFGPSLFMIVIMVLVTVTWALIISYRLTLVALSVGPVLVAVSGGYSHVSIKWEQRYNKAATVISSITTETLTKTRTVKALTLEQYFSVKHEGAVSSLYRVGCMRATWTSALFACSQSILLFVMAFIFYYAAMLVVEQESIQMQDALNVINLLVLGLSTASQLLESIPSISATRATAGRLLYYASLPVPAEDFQDRPSKYARIADAIHLASAPPKKKLISPFPVRMDGLHFSYQSKDDKSIRHILHNITLEIKPGTAFAITGPSGCGKSTLALLLLNIRNPVHIPQVRNVRPSMYRHPISFAGIPPNLLDLSALRSQIGYTSQQPTLFPLTIYQNIAYGLRDSGHLAKPPNIRLAAYQAGTLDFINSLPDGFNTVVGEGGQALSGGQAQRICLARALARRPKLLILDEPTSSLDSEAAEGVRQTLSSLIKQAQGSLYQPRNSANEPHERRDLAEKHNELDRANSGVSVVVITHSVDMMKICDKILVLDDGRIVEQGSFRELINKKGRFVDLIGEDRSTVNNHKSEI